MTIDQKMLNRVNDLIHSRNCTTIKNLMEQLGITRREAESSLQELRRQNLAFVLMPFGHFPTQEEANAWSDMNAAERLRMGDTRRNHMPRGKPAPVVVLDDEESVFDTCRRNWSGYRWHKIFGSRAHG
ncbi:hypothetical protein TUM12370_24710 [Salmonella enterica subsp. enterica serovar Choleraesuis]|nr:hypothetical protein TUM12370_24710 [Salmonella enterica subsp. enterica serovar Choleraesuis]